VNKKIMRLAGFNKEVDRVEQGLCPTCGEKVDTSKFTSSLDWKEYNISGMCKECQNKVFGESE